MAVSPRWTAGEASLTVQPPSARSVLNRRLPHDDVDAFGVRVKQDLGFTSFELAADLLNFAFERHVSFAVVRAFAQHERLDNAVQCVGRKFRVRHHDGRQRRIVFHQVAIHQVEYFRNSQAAPVSEVEKPSMVHSKREYGDAMTRGMCRSNTNEPIIPASAVAANLAWMPLTSAIPAARWPAPVAQAQNTCDGGIHAGTKPAVSLM